jgi:hypothetical protein
MKLARKHSNAAVSHFCLGAYFRYQKPVSKRLYRGHITDLRHQINSLCWSDPNPAAGGQASRDITFCFQARGKTAYEILRRVYEGAELS